MSKDQILEATWSQFASLLGMSEHGFELDEDAQHGVAMEIAMYDCVDVYGGPLLGLYIGGQVSRIYTSLFRTRILTFLL